MTGAQTDRVQIPTRMQFVMPDEHSLDERGRLIQHICESIRVYTPAQRIEAFYRIKQRLQKTPLAVLRQIVDEDVVNTTAAKYARPVVCG